MKRNYLHDLVAFSFRMIAFIGIIVLAKNLLQGDFTYFINWWIAMIAITITFYPIIGRLFCKFHDGGWIFAKMIGLALSGYVMWFLSSLHVLKFNHVNCLLTLLLCFVIVLVIAAICIKREHKNQSLLGTIQSSYGMDVDKVKGMITSEFIFFLFFLIWVYIRAFRPEVSNTESPMDYGFMAAMMRSDYLPATDIWMSGKAINYYYAGQYYATYLTKLSNVPLIASYNLALMTVAAGAFAQAYSIVYNILLTFLKDRSLKKRVTGKEVIEKKQRRIHPFWCSITGLLAGVSVVFAGNMHYVIYYWIIPFIQKLRNVEVDSYWWSNSTRYIGYNPEVANDKTIHEFPAYSFILGDLHAHVFNIIFVLSVLGLLYAYLLRRKENMDQLRLGATIKRPDFVREAFSPYILLFGFFIGLFHMTNFWDFPIYYVVCGAIILFSNAVLYQFSMDTLKLTAVHAVVIYGMGELVALPFTLNFEQISTRICLAENHSMPHQLLILWGLPVITVIWYGINRYRDLYHEGYITKKTGKYYALKGKKKEYKSLEEIRFTGEKNKLFQLIEHLQIADLFVLTIGLCAVGLIIMPEVIYVEDIYSSYARANTMFKLTYQGYIMFGLSMAYIFFRTFLSEGKKLRKAAATIGLALLLWTSLYSATSVKMWQGSGKWLDHKNYRGLDSLAFMKNRCQDDYEGIEWLNEHVKGQEVIVEGYGGSYSDYDRISAYTGLPTIIGWQTHEHLWRSSAGGGYPPELTERNEDVTTIYTSLDVNEILYYLKKYDVSYIYLGSMEAEQFQSVNNDILKSLGEIVYYSPSDEQKEYETAIIKVDKTRFSTVTEVDETMNDQADDKL